jgi:DUF4097 and DUF4098 domain-containing protein YvlB
MKMAAVKDTWIFLALMALAGAMPAAAETSLELRLDGARPVQLHNLAGSARLVPGQGELLIRARVSAEDPRTAEEIRLVTRERNGVLEVAVEIPSRVTHVQYDGDEFRRVDTRLEYEGRRIRVTTKGGERLRVDLEIEVPQDARLAVRTGIGPVTAERVRGDLVLATRFGHVTATDGSGKLRADTGSGRVVVAGFRGAVVADTGSGSVKIENVLGNVSADTGSGSVELRGIDGEVHVDTGSGSVSITDAKAQQIEVDTGSGSVRLRDVSGSLNIDTGSGSVRGEGVVVGPELLVDTGSGSVSLEGDLGAVRRVVVDTGSGSVNLRSTTPLSLRVNLRSGSGGVRVDAGALSEVESGRNRFSAVIGDGEGTARVSTGSGAVRISAP